MAINLLEHQEKAIENLKSGSILCGGVGTGKSLTSLAYYFKCEGGVFKDGEYLPMNDPPKDLYIITTAHKRDKKEWEGELSHFLLSTDKEINLYSNTVMVDSWNNIGKYENVQNAFFIFDEQRVVGSGAWVKSFIKISKTNKWILLSATPGDTWMDYIPVFIANGFYKNRTEFIRKHVVYSRFTKYPKVDYYIQCSILEKYRKQITVMMHYEKKTIPHHKNIIVEYDKTKYERIFKDRWNIFENKPIKDASQLCYSLRKLVNSDTSRISAVKELFNKHKKIIVFYNFNYELDMLRELKNELNTTIAEHNGHKHEEVPKTKSWIYLVQYMSGAEGWNCIQTNAIVFFSQNYSYKIMTQSAGRIDRLNTPFTDLYYYHIRSTSTIDLGILKALNGKRDFNEKQFVNF